MKYLAAAESSLTQANRFYLLMYTIAAVIALTAYLERSSIVNDTTIATKNEGVFVELKQLAEPVYSDLRWNLTQLYSEKKVATQLQSLLESVEQAKRGIQLVDAALIEPVGGDDYTDRTALRKHLNEVNALLYYNIAGGVGTAAALTNQPALRLAEVNPGSFEIAESINALKVDDAARYHWLSTLDIHQLNSVLSELQPLVTSTDTFIDAIALLAPYTKSVRQFNDQRINAERLWNKWGLQLNGSTDTAKTKLNYLRLRELTLAKIVEGITESVEKRVKADLRATGTVTNVSLPFIDMPLRLADAVKHAPWVMAFCLLCIGVYQHRAIRYIHLWSAKAEPEKDGDVVGHTPLFLLSYGALSPANINTNARMSGGFFLALLISTVLLALPTGIIWYARLYFNNSFGIPEKAFWPPSSFYIGLYVCAIVVLLTMVKSFQLLGLVSQGEVARAV